MSLEDILKLLGGGTGALCLLILAIKWLDKDRNDLLKNLHEEREGRIRLLEGSTQRCAEDRLELHKKCDSLQQEIRDLYKSLIGHKRQQVETSQQKIWSPKPEDRHGGEIK